MRVVFDNTALGFVNDVPSLNMPFGAWSDVRNVRFRDGAAEKAKGYSPALGSLSATSVYATQIRNGGNDFWVYASDSVVYATDGSTHARISTTSYTLAADADIGWTGGPYHGYLILNEASKPPQTWIPGLANTMQPLANWPSASMTVEVIRTFRDFIWGLRVTESGVSNANMLRWSDLSGPGSLPSSWDFTDPTSRAGRKEFAESNDELVDCMGMRDSLIVYKQNHTWIGSYVDLPDVWAFRELFAESGLLAKNCVRPMGSRHSAITTDDWILHDGNSAESLISKRVRRWLFNRINSSRFQRSFLAADYVEKEMLFCFPENGNDWPNLALVWNWSENTFDVRELGGNMTFGSHGLVPGSEITFDGSSGSFDSDDGSMDGISFSAFGKRVLFTDSASQRAFQLGDGELFASATMTAYVTRSYIPLDKSAEWVKRVLSLRPLVHGDSGHTLSFYVGLRDAIDDPVTMQGPFSFTIGSDHRIDLLSRDLVGRFLDIKAEYHGTGSFRFFGLEIEANRDGRR